MLNKDQSGIFDRIAPYLGEIERPSRYINHEWGSICEHTEVDFTFCMISPDTYELGQPNQAIRILVNCVNAKQGFFAERGYLPAVDMIEIMRRENIPLFSLESATPLKDFDAIGITIPHELAYTNVLEVLDLAGIAINASERDEDDPIVVAGGPCTYNPEPLHKFFDAFSIGEGEESIPELLALIKEKRAAGVKRQDIVESLHEVASTYVPSAWSRSIGPKQIEKRVYAAFSESSGWEPCIVPYTDIVHDRLNVEILRGCARGCRFCQAGMIYRPIRERCVDNIVESVKAGLAETGYDEVSLTSLSTTDHSQIKEILRRLNSEVATPGSGIRISIPSQRVDSFGIEMANLVAGEKRGGLTLAPEAGSQRLRDIINKKVTEEQVLSSLSSAVECGWRRAKLYFMIGLPHETDEDIVAIGELAEKCYRVMLEGIPKEQKGNLALSVSVAVFVPKVHTPFQWDGQITKDEALRRVQLLKDSIKRRAIKVSYHEPKTSLIEAVMSRGDRKIADLVELAWKCGARFDAWTEMFDEEAWASAASELDLDLEELAHKEYDFDETLPWDHISCGVDKEFLLSERKLAEKGDVTGDCTSSACKCSKCGVCFDLHCSNKLQDVRSFSDAAFSEKGEC